MAVLASASNRTLQRAINAFPRWPLYVFGSFPGLWVFWLALNDRLGADPVKTLEHTLGLWALRFIIATLTVTPIRRFGGPNLVRFRRALGLLAFFYACAHLSAYLIFDQGLDARAIFADILKRPYITIGMFAFAILAPLAVTSNATMIKRMGAAALAKAAPLDLRGGHRRRRAFSDVGEVVAGAAYHLCRDRRCPASHPRWIRRQEAGIAFTEKGLISQRRSSIIARRHARTTATMNADKYLVSKRPSLSSLNHFPKVDFDEYERKIKPLQSKLQLIQQAYLGTQQHAVIALEGRDTAGKGGVVRRLGWTLDPRSFKVHPIAAPTPDQKMQHYMQRFWKRLPDQGQIVVFDRSWYGRVLVERVEGFASKSEWKRAYREINEFERTLIDDGARIAKVFLHITAEEQAKRFKDRLANPLKRWKLSYEDFRNRDSWKGYTEAIEDMMEKTSTGHAPWYLVPANNKNYSRLAVFNILIDRLGHGVDLSPKKIRGSTNSTFAPRQFSLHHRPQL